MQADRSSFLGGSDAPAVLGLSEWRTPLQVWYEKTGQEDPLGNGHDEWRELAFFRGRLLEPVALKIAQRQFGLKIVKRSSKRTPNRYADSTHPWMAAEIDFEVLVTPELKEWLPGLSDLDDGARINGEVKSSHFFAKERFGEAGTDEIDVAYTAQCAHGQMVTGRQATAVVAMVGSDVSLYGLRRDEDIITELRKREIDFWQNHVLARVAPRPIVLRDVYRLFQRNTLTQIEATPEIAFAARKLREIQDSIKVEAEAVKELQFQIGSYMLGAKVLEDKTEKPSHVLTIDGQPFWRFRHETQQRIDTKLLEAEYAEVAEKCRKATSFWKCERAPKGAKK